MSVNPHRRRAMSRREMLGAAANGFGGLALLDLMAREAKGAERKPHYPAKAKSVIFLFMDGGPSQMDTFDPKPRLTKPVSSLKTVPPHSPNAWWIWAAAFRIDAQSAGWEWKAAASAPVSANA